MKFAGVVALLSLFLAAGVGRADAEDASVVPVSQHTRWMNFQGKIADQIQTTISLLNVEQPLHGIRIDSFDGGDRLQIFATVTQRNGASHRHLIYSVTSDELLIGNEDVEIRELNKRLKKIYAKGLLWQNTELLVSEEQENYKASPAEEDLVAELCEELDQEIWFRQRVDRYDSPPELYFQLFIERGKRYVVVTMLIESKVTSDFVYLTRIPFEDLTNKDARMLGIVSIISAAARKDRQNSWLHSDITTASLDAPRISGGASLLPKRIRAGRVWERWGGRVV